MESISLLLHGFHDALSFSSIIYCIIGVTVGMLVGMLPGLGPVTGTALLIPMTFGMEPLLAIIMLSGIYYGSMYGGTITSVLLNTPGEAASVITCIDGHQMAKNGRAGTALGVAAIGSFIGGIVAVLGLTLIGPFLSKVGLKFGPPEFFALMLLGMLTLVGLMGTSIVRGLIAAIFGLLLATIGMDPASGAVRFVFNQNQLLDGIDFTVLAIGLFGISEILSNIENPVNMKKPPKVKGLLPKRNEWKSTSGAIGRGTVLGFILGLIPGSNAAVSSLMSYSLEKRVSKNPSRFGQGAIEGVAGPETANNSHSGASLIPLFTLGLPSSPTVAVILGAFITHGLTPGPSLFKDQPDFVWALIASMFIGNVVLLIFNLPLAGLWAKITLIPYHLLFPIVLLITIVGSFAISNSLWDVGVMIVFGIIGYLMKKFDFPIAATILTFVLGTQLETSLLQSLTISEEGLLIFFTRPISCTIMIICILILVFSIASQLMKKKRFVMVNKEEEEAEAI